MHSDLIIASADGDLFDDRFAKLRELPLVDTADGGTADWTKVSLEQVGDKVHVEGTRLLSTADALDVAIGGGPIACIWAMGPVSGSTPQFHSEGMGVVDVEFFPVVAESSCADAPTRLRAYALPVANVVTIATFNG